MGFKLLRERTRISDLVLVRSERGSCRTLAVTRKRQWLRGAFALGQRRLVLGCRNQPLRRQVQRPHLDDTVGDSTRGLGDKADCLFEIGGLDDHESRDWKV